ncbi:MULTISPECIES: hypothetical protein [Burkholderia]|uniref:hypothetical protein n=1 Tax=Burkholderia TaxID=32008 RepID=UPI000A894EAD|nr:MULTISPECIES: hypothetical protein [Burkholderia]
MGTWSNRRWRGPAKRRSPLDRFFRHPAILLIIGFILTVVFGGIYSQWREHKDQRAELKARQLEIYRVGTEHLIQSIYLLEIRSYRLYDALTNTISTQEIRDKNREYEQAVSDFGTSLYANIQLAKGVAPYNESHSNNSASDPTILLRRLQTLFISADKCLHGMYLAWAARPIQRPIGGVCANSDEHRSENPIRRVELVRLCATDIVNALMSAEANSKFEPQQRYDAFVHELPRSSACASPEANP